MAVQPEVSSVSESTVPPPSTAAMPGLSRALVAVLAFACGVAVANIYFPQALTSLIARDLHIGTATAALVVTSTQLGYALGVFLLVPLGDRVPQRRLAPILLVLTAVGLAVAGSATAPGVLVAAGAVVGLTTVVPQILIPMAAGLVPDHRRGEVTGALLGGLIGGILLARTFGGALAAWAGWRTPYLIAAAVALLLAVLLATVLPSTAPPSRDPYPRLVALTVRLLCEEPELRRSATYQALLFGAFSAVWTSAALLLTGPTYGFGTQAIGFVALVGAASIVCTRAAGRAVDRRGPDRVNLVCFVAVLASCALLAVAGQGSWPGLTALCLGLVLLDAAVQSGQVANQARILALRPEARSRMNTAYMTCSFLGAAAGSWVGVRAYGWWGWAGVTSLAAVLSVAALLRHVAHGRTAAGTGGTHGSRSRG